MQAIKLLARWCSLHDAPVSCTELSPRCHLEGHVVVSVSDHGDERRPTGQPGLSTGTLVRRVSSGRERDESHSRMLSYPVEQWKGFSLFCCSPLVMVAVTVMPGDVSYGYAVAKVIKPE